MTTPDGAGTEPRREKLEPDAPSARSPAGQVALLLVLAALVYGVVLFELYHHVTFWFPLVDADIYDRMARVIAAGEPLPAHAYAHPPLYPYLLAVVYWLFQGADSYEAPLIAARILQGLLGLGICLLTWSLARRVTNDWVAIVSAVIMLYWGPLLFFVTQLLPTTLVVFLYLLSVWLLLRALDRPGWSAWLACGVSFGLAAIALPNILAFVAVVVIAVIAMALAGRPGIRLAHAVVLLAATVLTIAPVTVRNYLVSGHVVPIAADGGMKLYLGNNPDSCRTVAVRPGAPFAQLASEPLLHGHFTVEEADRYWYGRVVAYVREQPGHFLRNLAYKGMLFVHAREVPRNLDLYVHRQYSSVWRLLTWQKGSFGFPFGVAAPLAVLGCFVVWYNGRRSGWLIAYLLIYGATVVLCFVAAPYRMPIIPVVAVFTAAGGVWLWDQVRGRRWLPAGVGAVIVLVTATVVNWPVRMPTDGVNFHAEVPFGIARRALTMDMEGRRDFAEKYYLEAIQIDPDFAEAHLRLGELLLVQGALPAARERLETAVRLNPDLAEAHYTLGGLAMAEQRWDEAREHFRRALEIRPVIREARQHLASCLVIRHRPDEAIDVLREGLRYDREPAVFRREIARLLIAQGDRGAAREELEAWIATSPDDAAAHHLLGLLRFEREDPEEALDHLRRAVDRAPGQAAFRLDLATALMMAGRPAEAEQVIAAAPPAPEDPDHAVLRREWRRRVERGLDTLPAAIPLEPTPIPHADAPVPPAPGLVEPGFAPGLIEPPAIPALPTETAPAP